MVYFYKFYKFALDKLTARNILIKSITKNINQKDCVKA